MLVSVYSQSWRKGAYTVVEFGEEFRIKEEVRGCSELVCHGVKENFRAVVFVLLV